MVREKGAGKRKSRDPEREICDPGLERIDRGVERGMIKTEYREIECERE